MNLLLLVTLIPFLKIVTWVAVNLLRLALALFALGILSITAYSLLIELIAQKIIQNHVLIAALASLASALASALASLLSALASLL